MAFLDLDEDFLTYAFREQQGILACFSYQPAIVKANLQALHKLIKRAREVPVEKMPEKIEVHKSAPVFQEENLEIHNFSCCLVSQPPYLISTQHISRKSARQCARTAFFSLCGGGWPVLSIDNHILFFSHFSSFEAGL